MTRRSPRLSEAEIRDIIMSNAKGESKLSIANRLGVDRGAVIFHIRKHEHAYDEDGTIYALFRAKMRETCNHPSLRCSVCGRMQDNVKREDMLEIARLKTVIEKQQLLLSQHGLVVETHTL